MAIAKQKKRLWSGTDVALLRAHCAHGSTAELAQRLGLPLEAMKRRG